MQYWSGTRHGLMWLDASQYKRIGYCCLATDLLCSRASTVTKKQMANNRLNWEWRWLTLEEKSRYMRWTVHGGTTHLPEFSTFSHGGWNMNGGDTKLSKLHIRKRVQHFSLIFKFCQFPPFSVSVTSSLLWRHSRAPCALLVFWDNTLALSTAIPLTTEASIKQ